MQKTLIYIAPSADGDAEHAFKFAQNYIQICEGVLPKHRHQITVRYGKETCLCPGDEHDNLKTFKQSLSTKEIFDYFYDSHEDFFKSFSEREFAVGRFIILFNDNSIFQETDDNLIVDDVNAMIDTMYKLMNDKGLLFDEIKIDFIIFAENGNINYEDGLKHIVITDPSKMDQIVQYMAIKHLKLSKMQISANFQLLYLNIYEKSEIISTNLDFKPRDYLTPIVTESYYCKFINIKNEDLDIINHGFSSNAMIMIDNKWLLSKENGRIMLSKFGPPIDNEVLQVFSFDEPNEPYYQSSILFKLPPVLRITNSGFRWSFSRNTENNGLMALTQYQLISLKDSILFSDSLFSNKKSESIFRPILEILSHPKPNKSQSKLVEESFRTLFDSIRMGNKDILPDELLEKNDIKSVFAQILFELEIVIKIFSNYSKDHENIQTIYYNIKNSNTNNNYYKPNQIQQQPNMYSFANIQNPLSQQQINLAQQKILLPNQQATLPQNITIHKTNNNQPQNSPLSSKQQTVIYNQSNLNNKTQININKPQTQDNNKENQKAVTNPNTQNIKNKKQKAPNSVLSIPPPPRKHIMIPTQQQPYYSTNIYPQNVSLEQVQQIPLQSVPQIINAIPQPESNQHQQYQQTQNQQLMNIQQQQLISRPIVIQQVQNQQAQSQQTGLSFQRLRNLQPPIQHPYIATQIQYYNHPTQIPPEDQYNYQMYNYQQYNMQQQNTQQNQNIQQQNTQYHNWPHQ